MKKLLAFYIIILCTACTEVMVVVPEPTPPDSDKVVLVEELTGVSCPNCPSGSSALQSMIQFYNGNVIGVSIHGEFLADPLSNSKYDFRSELANDLEKYFLPWFGKPCAVINRVQQEGQSEFAISKVELWNQFVEKEFEKPQQISIELSTEFDDETRDLKVNVGVIPLEDLAGDLRISVMLTESHIIDPQNDQSVIIDDYEHNHVLRDMMTPYDGEGLASSLSANVVTNKSYNYTIPPEEGWWNANNMEVIVFVSLHAPSSKEVIQAAQAHVIE